PAGTYSVFVRDALGCVASTSVTIGQPTQVVIGSVPSTNSSCGNTNGALLINAAGGTAPLQYSINGGTNFQSSNSFSSLGAGIYNIVVKDANNCSVSTSATVIDNAGPSIAFQAQTNVACHQAQEALQLSDQAEQALLLIVSMEQLSSRTVYSTTFLPEVTV
ncbi:MAG TPA: hypothetical protein PK637_15580, partial [Flavobacteriales bacterium]|nr:hypothetical protein [Flavobacteriales bacterium]